jgi:histone deacetylase 1/2
MSALHVCHCFHYQKFGFSTLTTEHARYLYNLQESDTPSDYSDDDSWDSDESALSRRRTSGRRTKHTSTRKRMSLLTGQYFDIPTHEHGYTHFESGAVPGKAAKRRFFQSAARWDDVAERVTLAKLVVSPIPPGMTLGELMETGGSVRPLATEPELNGDWSDMVVEP